MGDICHTVCTYPVSNRLEGLEVNGAGVCRRTADQHLWFFLLCQFLNYPVINGLGLRVNTILGYFVKLPGKTDR